VYGQTKRDGETAALAACPRTIILRTAWVFGEHGGNFVKTMLRLGREHDTLGIVADQHGAPTYAGDIAAALITIAQHIAAGQPTEYGVYHFSGSPYTSWHGFASEIFRRAADLGLSLLVSSSFSKNMSLYGQRAGGLMVVSPNAEEAALVLGQLQLGVRRIYSSPPAQGGLTAYHVLSDAQLAAQWQNEVYEMRDRIRAMRQRIYDVLQSRLPKRDFGYFVKQRGMFSYTGLSMAQVHRLRDEFAIYLLDSGRMCIAGLNDGNVNAVADAFAAVFQE